MDRKQFYFKQKVKAGELNGGFDGVEAAFQSFVAGFNYIGIAAGAEVTENAPPNLTAVVAGPGTVYDQNQRRIAWFPNQVVNCALDEDGVSTTVVTASKERWISIFAQYQTTLSEPRVDGHGATVYFSKTESFKLNVAAGAVDDPGDAVPPPLRGDQILLADIKLITGQTAITNASINTDRTQYVYNLTGSPLALRTRSLQEVLQGMLDVINDLDSSVIDVPAISGSPHTLNTGTLHAVLTQGLSFINGLDTIAAISGSPRSLTGPGTQVSALTQLLGHINALDNLAAISGTPHAITGPSTLVSKLTQLLGFINTIDAVPAIADTPLSTTGPATVTSVLTQLLAHINDQTGLLARANTFTTGPQAFNGGGATAMGSGSSGIGFYGIGNGPHGPGVKGLGGGDGPGVLGLAATTGPGVKGMGANADPALFSGTGLGGSPRAPDSPGVIGKGGADDQPGVYGEGGPSGLGGLFYGGPDGQNAIYAEGTGDGVGIRVKGGPDDGGGAVIVGTANGYGLSVSAGAGTGNGIEAFAFNSGCAIFAESLGGVGPAIKAHHTTGIGPALHLQITGINLARGAIFFEDSGRPTAPLEGDLWWNHASGHFEFAAFGHIYSLNHTDQGAIP